MSYKRYVILVSFSALIIFGVPALSLFIWSSLIGEGPAVRVVDQQKLNPRSLYLSGIKDNVIDYKLELYNQLNPNVVAIGSSRSMEVRANFFKTGFVNLGGTVNSIPELEYMASRLIKLERKPRVVLIFADVWWFIEKYSNPRLIFTPPKQLDYLTFSNFHLLMKPLLSSGIVVSKENRLGFGAVYQNQGYDSAGSFQYVSLVTGETPNVDFKFQNSFGRIDAGTTRFEHSDSYSISGATRFNEIIDRLAEAKMHVLIIFPPYANAVYQRMMASEKYPYIDALIKDINHTHPLFNFTNPNDIQGANDCEFIDGLHGGETVYARMILQLAERDKYLYDMINLGYLSELISHHKGKSSPETIALYGNEKPESDFLGLGCRK